ncbi:hypothetical protein L9F63_018855 [Diploptera punctata]|uniref:Uncharacterized protein n=1 Tax=Diploptera punctata TaxID=6984 RepID=A0AAD7ZVJ3_DIPPU|nr:hypothetical protein L9F63_018855 [Diploptera punctata]
MFGIKFRSWMEAHIVRPRKKQQQQQQQRCKEAGGSKGKSGGKIVPDRPLLDSAGNSPTSPLIAKKDEPQKNQHLLRCGLGYSDDLHCSGGGASSCGKGMETITLPSHHHHHHHIAYVGNNLSSPESAYSTGYSTDGTSPGASFPPEYYINIRTGTHYFHSSTTPTAPCNPIPVAHIQHLNPSHRHLTNGHIREDSSRMEILNAGEGFDGRHINHTSTPKDAPVPVSHPHSHRRTESCDESPTLVVNPVNIINSSPQTVSQLTASPRQRNRIRTNPWVPSSTPSNSSAIGTNSSTCSRESSTNVSSCSSGGGCKHTTSMQGESSSSYGSGSDVTMPRKHPVHSRRSAKDDEHTSEENIRSPVNQMQKINYTNIDSWCLVGSVCSSSSSSSSSHTANNYSHSISSDLSDDDLTLNEMLGKYDESYVYEKETDILSDSDPTDCEEDYGETDFDTGQDGGDERDPQDDEELDFIDNGSYLELNPLELDDNTDKSSSPSKGIVNKGHCTYHVPHTGAEFVRKPTMRFRESFLRRSSARRHMKDENSSGSPGPSSRKPSMRKFNNEDGLNRRSSREGSRHRRHHETENAGIYNLNRILMQKMLFRVNEKGLGTRSAGNTPVSLRKKILNNETYNRLHWLADKNHNDIQTSPTMSDSLVKKRSYSISCGARSDEFRRGIPSSTYLTTFSSEIALIEADKEADRKYKELILEAEHILVSMKGSSTPNKCMNFMIPSPQANDIKTSLNENGNEIKETDREIIEYKEPESKSKTVLGNSTLNSPKKTVCDRGTQKSDNQSNSLLLRAQNEGRKPCEFRRRGRSNAPEGLIHASSSSSTDSDGSVTPKRSPDKSPSTPVQPNHPPLVTFRSIDLGHELGGSGYCPQSEPVKRKVYTCSATFDRLQKSLEKSHHQASLRLKAEMEKKVSDRGGNETQSRSDSLKEKLERLRQERLEVEAKVREAQEEERQRLDDKVQCQRQLSLFRRQMLVHTIEGLKRSLEDQSAKLQETYNQEQQPSSEDENLCRRHSTSSSNSNKEGHKTSEEVVD